jgi:hypothetical protein
MALTTNSQTIQTNVHNMSQGVLVNDAGGAVAVTLTLGFVPRHFRIVNVTDQIEYEWHFGMTNPGAIRTVAAGTRTLQTTEGPTVSSTHPTSGQVSIPATIILASKTFVWEAQD